MKTRWAAGTLLALLVTTGCSGPRAGLGDDLLGSENGGCAAVLPLARATVTQGRLVAVRPLRRGQGAALVTAAGGTPRPRRTGTQAPSPAAGPHLCVVAYQGAYAAGSLPTAIGHGRRFAIVILRIPRPEVRELLLFDQLPKGL